MKIGFGSYAFRWAIGSAGWYPGEPMDAFGFAGTSIQMGAETVQLCDNLCLDKYSDVRLARLSDLLSKNNLETEVGLAGASEASITRHIDICRILHSRILRITTDNGEPATIGKVREMIGKVLGRLEESGITLCIENHFDLSPPEIASLVREFNHPNIAVCYDVLNSITGLWGVNETFEMLKPFIRTTHIKNARIDRNGIGFRIIGTSLPDGLMDVPDIVTRLRRNAPQSNIFIETWMDRLDDEGDTLSMEMEMNRCSIEYLKTLL